MFKNFKSVERTVYGRGAFNQLDEIIGAKRRKSGDFAVFLLDSVFQNHPLANRVPLHDEDLLVFVDVNAHEPTTELIDGLVNMVKAHAGRPIAVAGIGGGSLMDSAKAVSLMLTNPGSSVDYQGWDLVKKPGVFHIGIPTIAGTGAEVSRTAVLTGPTRKLGLNSDFTIFDQIVLDPELLAGVPKEQRFYTGMDCYIHSVESLVGHFLNPFSGAYGEKSLDMCVDVFMNPNLDRTDADDQLMAASYLGGLSLTYSRVGACHALSYGLSYVHGTKHGYANCLVFNHLQDFYPEGVETFKKMMQVQGIELPQNLSANWTDDELSRMADISMGMEILWEHAIGLDWKKKFGKEEIISYFKKL